MPRMARIMLDNCAHHVVQRGHNKSVVFSEERDYQYYLDNLAEWKERLGCKVYAYCLMTNHIHLIVDPVDKPRHLGLLMKRLAARQTRWVNRLEGRSGSLWEGRYHSRPIETGRYLLACDRDVELNPVRARMTATPRDYPWPSYCGRMGLVACNWLDTDPAYAGLGEDQDERRGRYRQWMRAVVSGQEIRLIRDAVRRGQLTGGSQFQAEVERRIGVRIKLRGRGRPRKITGKETAGEK